MPGMDCGSLSSTSLTSCPLPAMTRAVVTPVIPVPHTTMRTP